MKEQTSGKRRRGQISQDDALAIATELLNRHIEKYGGQYVLASCRIDSIDPKNWTVLFDRVTGRVPGMDNDLIIEVDSETRTASFFRTL